MRWTITPEAAVFAVKFAFYPMICWPLPKNASGKHVIFQNIAWCVAVLIPGHGIPISIIYMASVRHDPARLTKALVEWGAGVGTVSKMIMLKVHQSRLQVAIANLEEFIKTAGRREREFMNRCIRKCGKFYLTVEVLTCIGASAFAASPLVLAQPVPGQIDYPFEWKNSTKLIAVIYCSQVFVLLQVTAGVTLDIQFALLLWHAGIRFELLAERFKNARRPREFDECAQEHQELIAYTTDITDAVRYYVINVLFTTSLVSISAGYQFVSHQPIEDVIQYSVLLLVACLQVAVYAWPADNLSNVSEGIAYAVYSSPWVGVSREWTSSIQLVMIRSQKPIIIATNGLFPILNLDFYGQFLVRTFSYFTTLRAVIG